MFDVGASHLIQRINFTIAYRCTPISTGDDERECERQGNFGYVLPPVTSAFLTTRNKFSFLYGKVEIRCRVPIGDYIYARKDTISLAEMHFQGSATNFVILK
jgi:hypothetical protein